MKLKISDLLDGYQEETLVLEEATPLSMKRIERMTMAAVRPKKKHPVRRFLPRALAAAAIISLLAVTAIADEREWKPSDWFHPAVDQRLQEVENLETLKGQKDEKKTEDWKESVAENQLAVIDEYGKIVNQSVSKDGATVTLLALYGDEYTMSLYFRVEAPEGTVLPDGSYRFRPPDSNEIPIRVPAGYRAKRLHYPRPQVMPDEDPTDNKKEFMISLDIGEGGWAAEYYGGLKDWSFHDDAPKTFILRGLYRYTGYEKINYRYVDTYDTLIKGPFEFDITHAHQVKRIEVDVTGCDYSGHIQDGKHPETGEYAVDYTYTVTPVRLVLSPFSAEIETRYEGDYTIYAILDFEVVMKDGSSQKIGYYDHGRGYAFSRAEDGVGEHVLLFRNPINLEQIDYVLIGSLDNGDTIHKVNIPAE